MSLWRGEPLILASKSSARQALLASARIPFEAVVAELDERAVETEAKSSAPGDVAVHLARAKALHVARLKPGRLVLGADQTLALGVQRFSKPKDLAQAAEQLRAFSDKTHHLHSGIAIARDGDILFAHVASAGMHVRTLSDDFIKAYLGEVGDAALSSVGAYQVEGAGIHLFDKIDGDHSTIMGLPLMPLLDFMRRHGALVS
jgi:septum formation protein